MDGTCACLLFRFKVHIGQRIQKLALGDVSTIKAFSKSIAKHHLWQHPIRKHSTMETRKSAAVEIHHNYHHFLVLSAESIADNCSRHRKVPVNAAFCVDDKLMEEFTVDSRATQLLYIVDIRLKYLVTIKPCRSLCAATWFKSVVCKL